MKTSSLLPAAHREVERSPVLQLIARTAESWNLMAPLRPHQQARARVPRIALRSAAVVRASG